MLNIIHIFFVFGQYPELIVLVVTHIAPAENAVVADDHFKRAEEKTWFGGRCNFRKEKKTVYLRLVHTPGRAGACAR